MLSCAHIRRFWLNQLPKVVLDWNKKRSLVHFYFGIVLSRVFIYEQIIISWKKIWLCLAKPFVAKKEWFPVRKISSNSHIGISPRVKNSGIASRLEKYRSANRFIEKTRQLLICSITQNNLSFFIELSLHESQPVFGCRNTIPRQSATKFILCCLHSNVNANFFPWRYFSCSLMVTILRWV